MSRNVTIALAVGVVLVGGLGYYVYSRKKAGLSIFGGPPLYSGYGPGGHNPAGPPVGKAPIGATLQDVKGVIQGGDDIIMAGKKAWDDVKTLFSNEPQEGGATLPADTDWA